MRGAGDRAGEIPANVRELILQHIDSVEQLEVLLLLHDHGDRDWSAEDVSGELRTNTQSTAMRLADLTARGLVAEGATRDVYRYSPRTHDVNAAVEGLAREYSVRRVSVITLIFAKPLDRIRSFADAFRFRRDSDA
jgi:hypothetical protein